MTSPYKRVLDPDLLKDAYRWRFFNHPWYIEHRTPVDGLFVVGMLSRKFTDRDKAWMGQGATREEAIDNARKHKRGRNMVLSSSHHYRKIPDLQSETNSE